jgi:hypothetical protein
VEARRVLTAIGLTDQQSRLFLELNKSTNTLVRGTQGDTTVATVETVVAPSAAGSRTSTAKP